MERLQGYFDQHGEEEDIGGVGDLTIVPMGNSPGAYTIWKHQDGAPGRELLGPLRDPERPPCGAVKRPPEGAPEGARRQRSSP
jgi:hypothetical protein